MAPVGTAAPEPRIGIVTHYMPPHLGGIELMAETLARAYRAAGLAVEWVASRAPAAAAPHELGRTRVPCWNGLERRLGVPWPVWGPEGWRAVARLVRWAHVVHVHDCLYLGSLLAVLAAGRARTPVVLSQHIGFVPYPSAILNAVERVAYRVVGRAVLRRATVVVACTPAAEAFVPALLGRAARPPIHIPYGVDTERFRPAGAAERREARHRLGVPPDARLALFVGRLVEKKGADLVLQQARREPAWHVLMVGDGPLRPDGAGRANLTWVPALDPEAMPLAYRAADALLLPSHGEGFPFAVLEALAAGLPVVTTRGEPFAQGLEREDACLAVDRTPDALADALRRLADAPELGARLGSRARELAVREWSRDAMERRYVALVRDVAAGRTAAHPR